MRKAYVEEHGGDFKRINLFQMTNVVSMYDIALHSGNFNLFIYF